MEQLARALREEMARRGHSYRQAAEAMGVSASSVKNWYHGFLTAAPEPKHQRKIAGYLQVPLYIVLGWTDQLTTAQVELLSTIPGSLIDAEALALTMAQRAGYLDLAPAEVLVAS